jgi:hypothetical protein
MADKSGPVTRAAYAKKKAEMVKKLDVLEGKLSDLAASVRVARAVVVR